MFAIAVLKTVMVAMIATSNDGENNKFRMPEPFSEECGTVPVCV